MYGGTKTPTFTAWYRYHVSQCSEHANGSKVLFQSGKGPADPPTILKGKSNFPGVGQGDLIIYPNVGCNGVPPLHDSLHKVNIQ